MKQNFKRKLLAGLLSVCMIFQTAGTVPAYASENAVDSGLPIGTSSVCTHHVHDNTCGYVEGTPCTHVHTEECSVEVTKCVHEHTAECYPVQDSGEATGSDAKEPTACTHICNEKSGCITKELACKHEHNAECGYKEGKPCTFDTATCESCKAKNTADNRATLAVEEVYAVYDGGTFYAATQADQTTPTTAKITDKNTIHHLYIMGASVPKELMFQSTTLKTVTCADTVTEIVEFAFSGCTSLTSVKMSSVTTIGNQAFRLCEKLASVEMSSVTKIDGFAFQACANLASIAMPNATDIGNYAFSGCGSLTSVEMPSATNIGKGAFSDCTRLESVAMPSATSIGDKAFSNCKNLTSLTLGETPPASVGTDVFKSCPTSRTLTIPGSIESQAVAVVKYKAVNDGVTDELWYGWTLPSITPSAGTLEITAGNVATTFGTDNTITLTATFDKAANAGKQRALAINRVEFKDGTTALGDVKTTQNANGKLEAALNVDTKGWAVGDHNLTATFAGSEELVGSTTKEVTVTVNESYAVYETSKFWRATKENPSTATSEEIASADKNTINHLYIKGESVPNDLMNSCTSLASVAIPSAISIGRMAFNGCTVLTSVKAPSTTTIGTYAFFDCTQLASLTLGATPPTVGSDAFKNCPTPRTLTIQGNTADQTAVLAAYKAVNDNVTDELWWGWTLPAAMVAAPSAGTLEITVGNATSNLGQDNAITLTATFDKAANMGKLKTLTPNQVEFKDGTNTLGTVTVNKNSEGKWVATLNVNTKDWAVGTHSLTATFAGNEELVGSTTNEVTVTVNESYAVYDGSSKKFYVATQADPSTATAEEIASTDKTTITNLHITGENVPDALMGDAGISPNTTLKTVTCANTVTAIGDRAFYQCKALTSVAMPSATTIGKYAFYKCAGLKSVELPNATSIGINAFYYCTSLTSAKLPKVTGISVSAFDGCAKLANVAMPGATSIGKNAFLNCKSLISASMPNAASISDFAFRNCISLTSVEMSSATTIGFQTFLDCKALTSVAMPNVTEIGVDAFFGCTKLASVEMPKVTTIGDKAFHGTALTSTSLPSVTTIGINAFEGCTGLTSVEMPKVTSISSYAFNGCTGLASLTLGATPPTVGTDAFKNCHTTRTLTIQCTLDSQADAVAAYKAAADSNPADELWYGWTLPKTINEVYAVYDGSKFWRATKATPTTATSEEITDQKTINHLYIKGESVPQSLMYDWKSTENTTLKTVTCEDTVTTIGNDAFYDCKSLTSANLPKATSIGEQAFSGCTSLASVELSSATTIGNDAFFGCTSLASVKMSSATTVGDRAFKGCTSLASVEMPNVTTIGNSTFNTCTQLTSVVLPKVETISDDAFSGCIKLATVSLPEATSINKAAFSKCTELTRAQLPKVTSIDAIAFNDCTNLATVEMPNVISIGTSAFNGCASLTSANLPNVTNIGKYAFKACTSLASVAMPKVTSIGTYAFYNCAKLASVEMSKVTSIGEQAFYGCASLTSVEMPSATTIAFQAFYGCAKLASVQLPKVTSIREKAFYGCESLESISLPEAISLDSRVFSGCTSLTSAQLPKVTTIGLEAFYNCTTLASLTLGVTPPTVGNDAFLSCLKTNGLTVQGNTAFRDTVLADYNTAAGNDDNTTDNKWYGWALPNALDGTGVSTSEGKLTAAGNTSANYRQENTITFTASFAKVGENKLRTLAENQISLLNGETVVESKAATLKDGVYSATFTVNTKDFTAGDYSYTATFDGNRSLVGSTATETVTVTINKIDQAALSIGGVPNKVTYGDNNLTLSTTGGSGTGDVTYAVTDGSDVVSVTPAGEVTVLKAGTATITATKAGDTNYNETNATITITVNAATPTITWGNATQTVTYTGSAAVITAPTATGVAGGTTPNGTISYAYKKAGLFSLFADYTDGLPTDAGEYTIKAKIAADGNYTQAESTNTMALTISRVDNSINNSSTTSMYYGESFLVEYSIVNKDTTQPTFTCEYKERSAAENTYTTTLPANAGEYTMRVSATATPNYNACSAAQDFVINKVPLNVTAGTAEPKKWDGTTAATVTGLTFKNQITYKLLEGDEALAIGKDFIVTKAEYAAANVGMNIIKATVALQNTTKANNYFLPSENNGVFPFEGTPIALADGPAAPTFSTMDDEKGKDTFTFNSTDATVYEYSKDSGATWTEITASGATTAINVGNVALVAGALQVRVKATDTHNASGVLANTAAQVFTASIDGSVAITGTATYGETLTATVTGTQDGAVLSYKWLDQNKVELQSGASNTYIIAGEAIGKTITVEVSATGYNDSLTSTATNAVATRAITVTAAAKSKTYGQTDPALTYTVSAGGLINHDTLTGALTRTAGEAANTYAIAQGTLDNAFYDITYVDANLTIGKASVALNVTVDPAAVKAGKTVTIKVDAKNAADTLMTSGWSQPSDVTLTGSGNAALNLTPVAGKSGEYTASYTVPAGTAVDTKLTFTAAVADSTGNYTAPANATGTLTVTAKSAVKLTLQADKTTGVTYGDTVTYTAKVEKNNPSIDAPDTLDGTVSFYLGEVKPENLLATKTIGSDTLAVTLDRTKLTAGSHTVSAVYSGNGDFATATQSANTTVAEKVLTWDVSGLSALKKADKTKTATITGNLLVGGAIKDADPGFRYTGISGEYDSAEAGERTVTVTVAEAVITNTNYALPVGNPTFIGTINPVNTLPTPPELGSDKEYKLEQEVGISTVPDALQNNSALDTPAKIEAQMKLSVQNAMSGVDTANIEIYDVKLLFSTDGGATWTEATETNFPSNGITVVLPYPAGTSKDSFNFTITHMFTTGAKAGTTETITPTKTARGLEFKLYSLSPIAVGYKAVSTDNGGGNGGGGSSATYYTITATAGAGGSISTGKSVSVREGDSAGFTMTPDKGYIIADVKVNGKSVGAVKNYVFTNVRSNQTIEATFKASGGHVNPQTGVAFEDVAENDWFYESVYNAVEKGWFAGTSDKTFTPNSDTTRGMIATVLHRMENEPTATATSIFEDVASGAYYAGGVNWAQENGIVGGYGNGKFGPQDNITREQMTSILYRYAQFKGCDVTKTTSLDSFSDADSVSNYAVEPMKWAVANGLITGKSGGILDPKGSATRAQVAAILTRFDELFSEE